MLASSILFSIITLYRFYTLSSAQTLPPGMMIGTDPPASPSTTGYFINNIGLNVPKLTTSKAFYGDVLGMRHIFTIQYTSHFSLTYMGFAQGGRNETGFQTGAEMSTDENNAAGLVKLLSFEGAESNRTASTGWTKTFADIGLVVPNMLAAQARRDRFGVNIVKRVGDKTLPANGAVANAFNVGPQSTFDPDEVVALIEGLLTTDLENLVFAEDPDGNCA